MVVALRQDLICQWIYGGRLTLEEFYDRRRFVPDLAIFGGGGAESLQKPSLLSSFFFFSLSPLSPDASEFY